MGIGFKTQTYEGTELSERIPPESEKHITGKFENVAQELTDIFIRAQLSGDKKINNVLKYIAREASTGGLSREQIADIDDLSKVFKRVEDISVKSADDKVLTTNIAAVYLATKALSNDRIPVQDKVEIATFAFMLNAGSISTGEFNLRELRIGHSNGYKPGAVTASINGLLSEMLTARESEKTAISDIANSVESGMTYAKVFLEKQGRRETAQRVVENAKGIRGEMVAFETLTELAEMINIALDTVHGNLSEGVNEVLSKISKVIPDYIKTYPADELSFYERITKVSFREIFADNGRIVMEEKIKEIRDLYYPHYELAKRLTDLKQVTQVDIIRTPSEEDYLGFSDFELVGFKRGKQNGSRYTTFQLPVDVKTIPAEEFETVQDMAINTKLPDQSGVSADKIDKRILAEFVHSKVVALTGNIKEDEATLNSLRRPPSAAAIRHLSESRQPLLMLRVRSDLVSSATREVSVQSHDFKGNKVFATLQKVVDLESIPQVRDRDLAMLAFAVATSRELGI